MDMSSMVRATRNRFWIALAFSLPIFAYAPMGMTFIRLTPPFGLRLDVFLFIFASAAIVCPVWPFVVAA
jgi:Cu2+-exporting ATPase